MRLTKMNSYSLDIEGHVLDLFRSQFQRPEVDGYRSRQFQNTAARTCSSPHPK